ncbi:hypothetical protein M3B43_12025 [Nesterenkonia massiliensis]|uniref:Uncharacterized protein n=1 Tax=Nesterenkonia massiliensis TaxID=1232429 RepID=A0ABT2HTL3_9MICC|nr:hypothetical protein [Nesterenkonia massiliensis]MCT1608025.1 hypothetical protein [Nesterenkonia massiliensis]
MTETQPKRETVAGMLHDLLDLRGGDQDQVKQDIVGVFMETLYGAQHAAKSQALTQSAAKFLESVTGPFEEFQKSAAEMDAAARDRLLVLEAWVTELVEAFILVSTVPDLDDGGDPP